MSPNSDLPFITVSNSDGLATAISTLSAGAGGTIQVENAGEAYSISKYLAGSASGTIHIVAADPGDPPVFDTIKLVQAQNISFEGLNFDNTEMTSGKTLQILDSSGISFADNVFTGSATGFYSGDGTTEKGSSLAIVQDSDGVSFTDNQISKYFQGVAILETTDVTFTGNSISQMTGDGLRLSGVQNMLIEGNAFQDFYGSVNSANHDDMIQVWSASYNTLITQDLTIRDNLFDSSGGAATQTIFIKNETYPTTGEKYQNITIEGNTIYNGHQHGVTVYDADGVTISDNTLLWNPDAGMVATADSDPQSSAPSISLYDVSNATVADNVTGGLSLNDSEAVNSGNTILSYYDKTSDTYIEKVLPTLTGIDGLQLYDYAGQAAEKNLLLSVNFDGGIADASSFESTVTSSGSNTSVAGVEGDGFHLDGSSKVIVDRFDKQLQSLDTFTIAIDLNRDEGSTGNFLDMAGSLTARVTADGALQFTMSPEGNVFTATTAAGLITAGDWHPVAITYDGAELTLYVDGVAQAQVAASGIVDGNSAQNFIVGNTWHDSLTGTVDNLTILHSALSADQVAAGGSTALAGDTSADTATTDAATSDAGATTTADNATIDATTSDAGATTPVDTATTGAASSGAVTTTTTGTATDLPFITVSNSDGLATAISTLSAGAGGTIQVENAGEAYSISKYLAGSASGTIHIVAADPGDPPVFDTIKLVQAQNISFEGLNFDNTEMTSGKTLQILDSSGISFADNVFTGSATGFYSGDGTTEKGSSLAIVQDSDGVSFTDNQISKYFQGVAILETTDVTFTGNSISQMTGDGLRLSGVQNMLIEGNAFQDFYGSVNSANHDDMIQVWSASYNTLITQDLTIRDNLFDSSGGAATQTIFIKNETYPTTGEKYQNITIEGNTIYNGHQHGVTVYDADGVTISDNTLLWNPDAGMVATADSDPQSSAPSISLYDVSNATVADNVTGGLSLNDSEAVNSGNTILSYYDKTSDTYIEKVLPTLTGIDGLQLYDYAGQAAEKNLLLSVNFDGGIADASSFESTVTSSGSNTSVAGVEGDGFHLDGSSKVIVDRFDKQLQSLDTFTIAIDLNRDEGSTGNFLDMAGSLTARVTADGALQFTMSPEGNVFTATTAAGLITAGDWHPVAITYDGAELTLYVDGVAQAQVAASGIVDGNSAQNFIVGNTWHDSLTGTVDNLTILHSALSADQVAAGGSTALAGDTSADTATTDAATSDAGATTTADNATDMTVLFSTDFSTGVQDMSGHDTVSTASGDGLVADGYEGAGYHLSADSGLTVQPQGQNGSFALDFALHTDTATGAGQVVDLGDGFSVVVDSDGALQVLADTGSGSEAVVTTAAAVTDGNWHEVALLYDAAHHQLSVSVDHADPVSATVVDDGSSLHLDFGGTHDSLSATIDDLSLGSLVPGF